MKGWKWSDGSTVDAKSVIFYMNMVEAEKANWYATTPGLLPDNVTSYKATGPNQVTFQLDKAYSSIWFTYNQLAELTPMPEAWDITSLSASPGSGGCATDSAADGWAKCKAVYTFMTAQSKDSATYATSKLWQVVDGPWKLSAYSSDGHVTLVPNTKYSGSPKPQLAAVKIVPFTDDSTEYTALKTGQIDVGYIPKQDAPPKPANSALPATNPLGSSYTLQPFYQFGIYYAQPNFNNPTVGFMVRQLYMRQALQDGVRPARHRQGDLPRVRRPELGAVPEHAAQQPVATRRPERERPSGPVPVQHHQGEVAADQPRLDPAERRDDLPGPGQVRHRHQAGPAGEVHLRLRDRHASVTAQWQTYKSDASKAGIDINLVGQTFNTIIGESAPCAPMGPKCNVQVFAFGGWAYNGPGFEPTGEPLFATGAGSNSGNYSNPQMDSLITATHTSSDIATFHNYATYGAQQLPFVWAPNPYGIEAVSSKLHNVTFNALYTLLPEYWYFTK